MSVLDKDLVVKGFSDGDSITEQNVLDALTAVVSAIAFSQTASPEGYGEQTDRFYAILRRTDEQEKKLLLALMKYLYQFQSPEARKSAVRDITRKLALGDVDGIGFKFPTSENSFVITKDDEAHIYQIEENAAKGEGLIYWGALPQCNEKMCNMSMVELMKSIGRLRNAKT